MKMKIRYFGLFNVLLLTACATTQNNSPYYSDLDSKNLTIHQLDKHELQQKQPMYDLLVAELSLRNGDNKTAVDSYLNVLDEVNDGEIAERAVKVAVHNKDYKSALLAANKWQQIEPKNHKSYEVAATLALRLGDLDLSFAQFKKAISVQASQRLAFTSIMSILAREKHPSAVIEVSNRLAEAYPKQAYAQFMAAVVSARLSQASLALEYIDKAIALEDIPTAYGIKAKQLLKLGRRSEALETLKLAVEKNPKNHDLRMTYARLLIDVKQYKLARTEFTKLLAQSPKDADLLYTLGLLSLEANLLNDAEKYLSQLLTSHHRRGEAIYYLGRIAESKKDLSKAVDWYKQVKTGDFEFDAQLRVAKILAKMGKIQQASESLDQLKSDHQNEATLVRIYLVQAAIYSEANQQQKALDVYDVALKKIPNNNDLLYSRAITYEKIGDIKSMEEDIKQILKTEPDHAHALNAIGFALTEFPERLEDSYHYIKKALALSPDEGAIIDSMGWVEYKRGNLKRAESLLRKAYAKFPDSEIAAHLGEVLWQRGKRPEAKKVFEQAIKAEPSSTLLKKVMRRLIP